MELKEKEPLQKKLLEDWQREDRIKNDFIQTIQQLHNNEEPVRTTEWIGLPTIETPKLRKPNTPVELKEVLSDIGSQVLDSKYTLTLKQLMQLAPVLCQYLTTPPPTSSQVNLALLEETMAAVAIDH